MSRILWRYVAREIAVPTLLALVTITFILLLGQLNEMIGLLLQPSVTLGMIAEPLKAFLPSMVIFALPMSMLVGILIGVGRLTLDREILAIQASGVNVLRVFLPSVGIALLISVAVLGLSGKTIPRMMRNAIENIADLQFQIMNSLPAGTMHSQLGGGGDNDTLLFFEQRDPKTQEMIGVTLKQEGPSDAEVARQEQIRELKRTARREDRKFTKEDEPAATERKTEQMLIFAERGVIKAVMQRSEDDDDERALLKLELKNGSIHRLAAGDKDQDYTVVNFDVLERWQPIKIPETQEKQALTNKDLLKTWNNEKRGENTRFEAYRTLIERYSVAWASLVFAFFGIPLAIWIKPTGKSWGIFVAICVMLVYYVLMNMGLSMLENKRPAGLYVAFLPNFLFAGLGGLLWWRTLSR